MRLANTDEADTIQAANVEPTAQGLDPGRSEVGMLREVGVSGYCEIYFAA